MVLAADPRLPPRFLGPATLGEETHDIEDINEIPTDLGLTPVLAADPGCRCLVHPGEKHITQSIRT